MESHLRTLKRTTATELATALGFAGEPVYASIVVAAIASLTNEAKEDLKAYDKQWKEVDKLYRKADKMASIVDDKDRILNRQLMELQN